MLEEQREGFQEELIDIIFFILECNFQLYYYQGYYDIVVIFLLVVGERLVIFLVEKLFIYYFRDFMDLIMDNIKYILNYLMFIIDQVNLEFYDFMQSVEVGIIFVFSWFIIWFGYVLFDFRYVVWLYDFFLVCYLLMFIYFVVVIVLYCEQEVLDCDCDMVLVYYLLFQIFQDLFYEILISRVGDFFVQFFLFEFVWEVVV